MLDGGEDCQGGCQRVTRAHAALRNALRLSNQLRAKFPGGSAIGLERGEELKGLLWLNHDQSRRIQEACRER